MTILRVWHGYTTPENADVYEALLKQEIFDGIAAKNLTGFHGIELLRRKFADDEIEFMTIMRFDNIGDVKHFTGDDYEVAYVPEAARAVLKRFDARAQHYDLREVRDFGSRSHGDDGRPTPTDMGRVAAAISREVDA